MPFPRCVFVRSQPPSSDGENIVRVWNLNEIAPMESDKTKGALVGNTKPVVRAAFYDDMWVTGGSDCSIRLYVLRLKNFARPSQIDFERVGAGG